jgi:hypothetical protein
MGGKEESKVKRQIDSRLNGHRPSAPNAALPETDAKQNRLGCSSEWPGRSFVQYLTMDPYEERFKAFDHHAAHLLGAIRLCLECGYIVPAMMLTFAAIDGMAWMYREHEGPSNGNDFKKWTDEFMIGHLKAGIVDSADFWAARNALLHVQSSYSEANVLGKAKVPVILTAKAIVDRFEVAIQEFRSFIDSSERTDVILDRCGAWFDYGPPLASDVPSPDLTR